MAWHVLVLVGQALGCFGLGKYMFGFVSSLGDIIYTVFPFLAIPFTLPNAS
jgi:hypothetical protein